jgi:hypothetical protein
MPNTVQEVARSLETPVYYKRKIVIGLVLLIIFVVTIEIWVANRLATFGEKINGLEATKYSLKLENDYIRNQIAQKKSLSLNQKKSLNLGFDKIKKIEYIKTSPFALNSNKF